MKYIKLLCKIIVGLICLLLLLIRGYVAYQQLYITDSKVQNNFVEYFPDAQVIRTQVDGNTIRYLDTGNTEDQLVLMIHGAPGDLNGAKRILQDKRLHSGYRFILIDRLGYGGSEIGSSQVSIQAHSDSYIKLLQEIGIDDDKLPLVVGHSYGATIALKMVMDWSEKLSGSIVVSGAVDPDHEKVFAISHLIKRQPFKFLSSPMFWVANDEKLAHVQSLQDEVQNFQEITKPVHVIHGTSDSIVPYQNALYMQKRIPEEYLTFTSLNGKDHALHMTDPEVFVEVITGFFSL